MEEYRRRLNPLYGIIAFVIMMAVLIFVFSPIQYYFGMAGVAMTEIGLLLMSLLAARLTGQSLREVFPIRRPKLGQLAGTVLIWAGCFLCVMISTLILMYFFPEGYLEVNYSMSSMFSSIPAFLTFLIVAVMPAVCEEAMHRGFIQYTFGQVKRDWVVVLCIGVIFGIFHLDPYRFLPTAILGMGLAYLMCKTHNLLLPALFHFINNALSVLSSLGSSSDVQMEESLELFSDRAYILTAAGAYLMIGALAPLLLFAGSYFLRKSSGCLPKHSDTRTVLTVTALVFTAAVMLIAGFALLFLSTTTLMNTEELLQDVNQLLLFH